MPKVKMKPSLRIRKERLTDRQRDFAAANLRLLRYIVNRQSREHLEYDDCFQEAYFGFAKAAKKYKPKRGTKLSALANKCVHNHVYKMDRSDATIRIPIYLQGERGDDHHLVAKSRKAMDPVSLQALPRESRLIPLVPPSEDAERNEAAAAVREALASLKPRERDIVLNMMDDRYGIGRMMSKHRLSRHKIRIIYHDACEKLRIQLARFA